ncbi:MAG: hypothetical protein COU31_00965 [Candidatus Magasanikbacteria bacterium CG10_big_fil_rev_8_21_14_0_10_40_10]|uniref:Uncharacterized protein n=1 Tax=Candidatus Magasanikbacteria bacterium CG10_big_fil_rev_8_21_14_0_10_40_10 TaxID=1974648 RepID=A0A2M6W4R1_9BACT|nr:MAG: hypothetical protein COU31_00965 [Candidatus Magasanikbacteria bacterium CG10_big_fil_rev_8_21_14_0_10_40_10]
MGKKRGSWKPDSRTLELDFSKKTEPTLESAPKPTLAEEMTEKLKEADFFTGEEKIFTLGSLRERMKINGEKKPAWNQIAAWWKKNVYMAEPLIKGVDYSEPCLVKFFKDPNIKSEAEKTGRRNLDFYFFPQGIAEPTAKGLKIKDKINSIDIYIKLFSNNKD